jgi:hypothetical protein
MAKLTLRLKDDDDFEKFKKVMEFFGGTITGIEPVPEEPGIEYSNFLGMQVALMNVCSNCAQQFQGVVCPHCGAKFGRRGEG